MICNATRCDVTLLLLFVISCFGAMRLTVCEDREGGDKHEHAGCRRSCVTGPRIFCPALVW